MQKRILAAHDISCVGKCSLTVALPVLSAVGLECSVLPTAVLSTHTGGFTGYTFRDLTEDVGPILDHWATLDLKVDAIYTGYLGSFEQLRLVERMFEMYPDALKFTDPVMADNGKLYAAFDRSFVKGMAALCEKADYIIPNLTEATLMLGEPYVDSGYDEGYIRDMLKKLCAMGPSRAVLTGVSLEPGKLGAMGYDSGTDRFASCFREKIDGYYHGTGDVFGSSLLAAIMGGADMEKGIKTAVDFTVNSLIRTKNAGTDIRYGVEFEREIPNLIAAVGTV
ncbi:MAG: pyridoxamine kinase [Oscillospiraceae bacterium]|nr:pyridoxamine kinase [Oscillospiraceae bacterium]